MLVSINLQILFPYNFFYFRTSKRVQSFYDGTTTKCAGVCHIPMAEPFCVKTREVRVYML